MKTYVILAHDPGSVNYGYALVAGRVQGKRLKVRILESGKLTNTITQMKKRRLRTRQREAYVKEIEVLVKKYKPDWMIAERYMTRGIRGLLVECVNSMLGSLEARVPIPCVLVPAVTWKQEWNRTGLDLKALYKVVRTTPHQLDAVMMGIFAMLKILELPRQKFKIKQVIRQLEATSKVELKRKRK